MKDWAGRKVDKTLDQVSSSDYDPIVLPGGQINPDLLRVEPKALKFIKEIFDAQKIVAAVCRAPWLLIETGIAKGRKMTSYKSIKTDVINAGAKWEDSQVVVDQGVITSRHPGDLEAFSAKIIEEVKEGRHIRRSAAEPPCCWPSWRDRSRSGAAASRRGRLRPAMESQEAPMKESERCEFTALGERRRSARSN